MITKFDLYTEKLIMFKKYDFVMSDTTIYMLLSDYNNAETKAIFIGTYDYEHFFLSSYFNTSLKTKYVFDKYMKLLPDDIFIEVMEKILSNDFYIEQMNQKIDFNTIIEKYNKKRKAKEFNL